MIVRLFHAGGLGSVMIGWLNIPMKKGDKLRITTAFTSVYLYVKD